MNSHPGQNERKEICSVAFSTFSTSCNLLGYLSHLLDPHAASVLLRALFWYPSPMQRPTHSWFHPTLPLVKCCYLGSSSHKMVLSPSCLTENVMKKKCILYEKSELPYTTNWSCSLWLKSLNFFLWKKRLKNETCTAYLIGQLSAKSIQLVCDSRGIWE